MLLSENLPRPQDFLHGYIRNIRDIMQLCQAPQSHLYVVLATVVALLRDAAEVRRVQY